MQNLIEKLACKRKGFFSGVLGKLIEGENGNCRITYSCGTVFNVNSISDIIVIEE